MSFYGKVVNLDSTQFNFDKVYSNRYEMEQNISTDGIYLNRIVLVEYDSESQEGTYKTCYLAPNGIIYAAYQQNEGATVQEILNGAITFPDSYKIVAVSKDAETTEYWEVKDGTVICIPATEKDATNGEIISRYNFLAEDAVAVGTADGSETLFYQAHLNDDGTTSFTLLTGADSDYVRNYAIDAGVYGKSRSWDSTVWQKVYRNNKEAYIMIADLNTTMPQFGIQADAPTITPLVPHFDSDSTNRFYKIHFQPSWGFRIKAAKNFKSPVLNSNGSVNPNFADGVDASTNAETYQSDEKTIWTLPQYDENTGIIKNTYFTPNEDGVGAWSENSDNLDAAIFYNKAGFDVTVDNYVSDYDNTDKISVEPTGRSGHLYYKHDGSDTLVASEDTQELSIYLPSLGNTIAKIWNIVYGTGDETTKERNTDINWDSTKGIRLTSKIENGNGYEYNVQEVNTIAGCINSVHDLMGMIITPESDIDFSTIVEGDERLQKIYFKDNKFYRIHPVDLVAKYNTEPTSVTIAPVIDDKYSFNSGETYQIVSLTDGLSSTTAEGQAAIENNQRAYNLGQIWNTNITDIVSGIVVASLDKGNKYEFQELTGFADNLNTIHGLILKINDMLEMNSSTRDTNSVQGCINSMKDILRSFKDLTPKAILTVDQFGKIISAEIDTDQTNTQWKSKASLEEVNDDDITGDIYDQSASGTAFDRVKGQWITVNVDNSGDSPVLTIHHNYHKIKALVASLNKDVNECDFDTLTYPTYSNYPYHQAIPLTEDSIDAMGHVVAKNQGIWYVPNHFKDIIVNNQNYQPYYTGMLELSNIGARFNYEIAKQTSSDGNTQKGDISFEFSNRDDIDKKIKEWEDYVNSDDENLQNETNAKGKKYREIFNTCINAIEGNGYNYSQSDPYDLYTLFINDDKIINGPFAENDQAGLIPVRGSLNLGGYIKTFSTQEPLEIVAVNKWIQLKGVDGGGGLERAPHWYTEIKDQFISYYPNWFEKVSESESGTEYSYDLATTTDANNKTVYVIDTEIEGACTALGLTNIDEWKARIEEYKTDLNSARNIPAKLEIAHKISPVTSSEIITEDENNNPSLYNFDIDQAGHITGLHPSTLYIGQKQLLSDDKTGFIADNDASPMINQSISEHIADLYTAIRLLKKQLAAQSGSTLEQYDVSSTTY